MKEPTGWMDENARLMVVVYDFLFNGGIMKLKNLLLIVLVLFVVVVLMAMQGCAKRPAIKYNENWRAQLEAAAEIAAADAAMVDAKAVEADGEDVTAQYALPEAIVSGARPIPAPRKAAPNPVIAPTPVKPLAAAAVVVAPAESTRWQQWVSALAALIILCALAISVKNHYD